jgi:hypothetical protein
MTRECSVLRIEGFLTSNIKTGALADESDQKPISELRRRMLEDMAVRKFREANSWAEYSRSGSDTMPALAAVAHADRPPQCSGVDQDRNDGLGHAD